MVRIVAAKSYRVCHRADGAAQATLSWQERHGIVVELRSAQGHLGKGEASPLPGYSLDSLEEVEAGLRELWPRLETLSFEDPLKAAKELSHFAQTNSPALIFLLEQAFWEIYQQESADTLAEQLGLSDFHSEVSLSGLVNTAVEPEKDHQLALEAGVRSVKLKIGAPGQLAKELAWAEEFLSFSGIALRLDANRKLSEDWPQHLAAFHAGVEFLEEPEANLCSHSPVSLALDESLQGVEPSENYLLRLPEPYQVLVLKPMVLGGLAITAEWVRCARAVGKEVVLSHLMDGELAMKHYRELAQLTGSRLAHGLGPRLTSSGWVENQSWPC